MESYFKIIYQPLTLYTLCPKKKQFISELGAPFLEYRYYDSSTTILVWKTSKQNPHGTFIPKSEVDDIISRITVMNKEKHITYDFVDILKILQSTYSVPDLTLDYVKMCCPTFDLYSFSVIVNQLMSEWNIYDVWTNCAKLNYIMLHVYNIQIPTLCNEMIHRMLHIHDRVYKVARTRFYGFTQFPPFYIISKLCEHLHIHNPFLNVLTLNPIIYAEMIRYQAKNNMFDYIWDSIVDDSFDSCVANSTATSPLLSTLSFTSTWGQVATSSAT